MKGDIILVIGAIAAACGLLAAILGLISQKRALAAVKAAEETAKVVQTISVNVDGRLDQLFTRQAQLLGTLHKEGIPIPDVPPPKPKVQ